MQAMPNPQEIVNTMFTVCTQLNRIATVFQGRLIAGLQANSGVMGNHAPSPRIARAGSDLVSL
ncbi:hypothetical protein BH24CHL4_BH24CHL4_10140 [soil metagenome]